MVFPVVRGIGTNEVMRDLRNFRECIYLISFEGKGDFELMVELSNQLYSSSQKGIDPQKNLAGVFKRHNLFLDGTSSVPYCLVTSSAHREPYDVDLSIPNMKALVLGEADQFLVHGLMRLFKKSDVTVLSPSPLFSNQMYKEMKSLEDRVRIISNGKEAVVFRED